MSRGRAGLSRGILSLAVLCGTAIKAQEPPKPKLRLEVPNSAPSPPQNVPKMKLEIIQEFPIPGTSLTGMYLPVRCDGQGNIYLRFAGGPLFSRPIVKISAQGEQKTAISTDSAPGSWKGSQVYDFAVGRDGQLYVLVTRLGDRSAKKIDSAVLVFGEDGRHRFTTELNLPMSMPSRLAIFPSGDFLVTGYLRTEDSRTENKSAAKTEQPAEPDVTPVAVVSNRNGELIQTLKTMEGTAIEKRGEGGLPVHLSRESVDLASWAAGDDGNVYLMFPGKEPLIFAVSPHGTVARALSVTSPSERAIGTEIQPAPGLGLILKFGEKAENSNAYPADKTVFSLIDPLTGQRLADYESNMTVGSALACYTSRGLLFLGKAKEARQMAILLAQPR